ncbi:hypothetical protein Godav_028687 [Gossypium davidsonii]|uniref:Uncharacterized protein n=2 Tax=Gossypium TaxID=3633 RepID=A0A7J8S0A0_GOSDV|nr:hypothetical protein [Gossypium davidsonii]MBA0654893.1 hypothetical protein [Gossypium klotzschianum]
MLCGWKIDEDLRLSLGSSSLG